MVASPGAIGSASSYDEGVVWLLASVWFGITSPHFEVLTNVGESAGRGTLERLERVRQIFTPQTSSPLPVRVFVFRSESDFRPFRPSEPSYAFFQAGAERNYIAMLEAGPQSHRVLYHEYVHLLLNHNTARMPRWLEEGLAEFYSTLEAGGGKLRLGLPIATHLATLASREWINPRALLTVERDSPYYNERGKTGIFYAQSWALVHMLNLDPYYRGKFVAFLDTLSFENACQKTADQVMADLRRYTGSGRMPFVDLPAEPLTPLREYSSRRLDEVEVAVALADLFIRVGKGQEAEKRLRNLPRTAPVETMLGEVSLHRGNYRDARTHLEKALQMGSRDASTHFEYAMLLRDTGGDHAQVLRHLHETVRLNENFAEAHFLLGVASSEEKRYPEAISYLARAAQILPRQSYFWHALALAYHGAGEFSRAREAVSRALDSASTEHEFQMARAAAKLVSQKAAAPPPKKTEVTTPPSWQNPKGDSKVEGILRRIDCLGQNARFTVESEGKDIHLFVANPGEILLRNSSSLTFQFTCGPQKPTAVSIEYLTHPDPMRRTAGDVTSIEFR